MEISILGAGAMGSFFGGLLAEAGHDVTLLDIDDVHLAAVRTAGLSLEDDRGERRIATLAVSRPEAATRAPELMLVFTKTLHTAAALASARGAIGPRTQVLSLQNGLGNVEALGQVVPAERVLIGVTTWPADLLGPGRVRSHGQGAISMMAADGVARPEVAAVAEALSSAGLACQVDTRVWAAIWEKVAFNAALNSLCAVLLCAVDGLSATPDGQALAYAIVDEVIAVAQARGVTADGEKCRANVDHAMRTHGGHKPSMLQDILAGRRTEIEAINGAVVAAADAAGVAVPVARALLGLVRLRQAQAR